jgi:hypothetical protein
LCGRASEGLQRMRQSLGRKPGGLMESIENWRGELIPVARSRGGVVACADPFANLLRGDVSPWPPPVEAAMVI